MRLGLRAPSGFLRPRSLALLQGSDCARFRSVVGAPLRPFALQGSLRHLALPQRIPPMRARALRPCRSPSHPRAHSGEGPPRATKRENIFSSKAGGSEAISGWAPALRLHWRVITSTLAVSVTGRHRFEDQRSPPLGCAASLVHSMFLVVPTRRIGASHRTMGSAQCMRRNALRRSTAFTPDRSPK